MKVIKKQVVISEDVVDKTHTERNVLVAAHHPFIVNLKFAFQVKPAATCCLDSDSFVHLP
jgi:hypothetical protein